MRLPVSRARYDLLERNMTTLMALLRADLATADARFDDLERATLRALDFTSQRAERAETKYDELLRTTLALKAAGASVVPIAGGVVEPPPPVVRETDELKALIAEQAGRDTARRAMMLRQLMVDRAAKVPEAEIREAIVNGVTSDGVPA